MNGGMEESVKLGTLTLGIFGRFQLQCLHENVTNFNLLSLLSLLGLFLQEEKIAWA